MFLLAFRSLFKRPSPRALHTATALLQEQTCQVLEGFDETFSPPGSSRKPGSGRPFENWKTAKAIVAFQNIENDVLSEIKHYYNTKKVHLTSLPRFSSMLDGLRPHEMTVFTGPTGCGKTTVLSQMSLDYAIQGLPVIWGSFEVRNTRLTQTMLQQLVGRPLTNERGQLCPETYEGSASRLRQLPIQFLNMFGSHDIRHVLEILEAALRTSMPPRLAILDNLQFMLSGQGSTSLDRWEIMDRAIALIRDFCNRFPIHVIVVIHPRKEIDDMPLGLASVSGSAKATQEADNVVILQKMGEERALDLKKNRYSGSLGRVRFAFVPESRCISEEILEDIPGQTSETAPEANLKTTANSNDGTK